MTHTLHIPFKLSIEKVNEFIGSAEQPMEITESRWPGGNLQVFVKPWRDRPHIYCIVCQVAEMLPKKEYRDLYHSGKKLYATISPNADKFDITISDAVPAHMKEKELLASVWRRLHAA
jgi:hypothetical protein